MAPIEDPNTLLPEVDNYIKSNDVMIFSKTTCPYCTKVKELFNSLEVKFFTLELDKLENGSQMQQAMAARVGRSTVPQVFVRGQHIGGCDDTMSAHNSGKLQRYLNLPDENNYDYDLIVIGGGSGGLAASKEAAKLGKKVAVFDFVKPTPIGTTWGLGGTCVNVGCIPKKLMHHSSLLGQFVKDAEHFGWDFEKKRNHIWATMRENVQNHIKSLNWNYKKELRIEQVSYFNAYAEFVDLHKIKATDKKGKETFLTSKDFIIATGERPNYPEDTEGAKEYGITSDDIFSLKNPPGKTLVVGASYVALECAGFLAGFGLDVTVMVRSILLRGFDQDMAERIGKYMQLEGIKFIRPCVPTKVEKIESAEHKLKVTAKMQTTEGEEVVGEYDTVLFAIGRKACTTNIGLENVGVKVSRNNKIPTIDEQTNVPNIYAIGDVLEGKLELTPAAIKAGQLLARRLYANSQITYDYNSIPTTVFTPLEYGCIGFPEKEAIDAYGEDNIEVYHSNFFPLEWTTARGEEYGNVCYAKIICLKTENERVIGFHYLGPNAGEVTQGFAVLIKFRHTKAELDEITGIHPTCAEVFTTMSVTKRSGASPETTGC